MKNRLPLAIILLTLTWACANNTEQNSGSAAAKDTVAKVDTVKKTEVIVRPVHPYFNAVMHFISGQDTSQITFAYDKGFFSRYSEDLNTRLRKVEEKRLNRISEWYSGVLTANERNDSLPVFYPFSGGDFLHLHYLYPNANDYVMMAIEPVGYFPDLEKLSKEAKDTLLIDVNYNMRDVVSKSYFITKNMHADLRSNRMITGMILPIFWGLGATGNEIIDVEDASLDSAGKVVLQPITKNNYEFKKGVRITFRKKGETKERTLTYFRVDISNDGFAKDQPMTNYLAAKEPYNSFMKAASYLPHGSGFSKIRDQVLTNTQNHIQDDTGIPYRYFPADKFIARFFGRYKPPVSCFSQNLYQKDLAEAYQDSTLYGGLLNFSMGYHWGTEEQNQMVFMRKK